MLEDAGYQAWFVGGVVRNALIDAPVSDLDLSTDALPETVMSLAKAAGLKAIPTGIDHGTVTIVSNGEPVEVTTFRRDVATDGRHAVVAFSDSMEDDARRRDFTMNALYCDIRGGGSAGWLARPARPPRSFHRGPSDADQRRLPAHPAVFPVLCLVWRHGRGHRR